MKKIVFIILGVVVLVAVAFAVYWFQFKDKSSTGGGSITSIFNANCRYNDADLCKFVNQADNFKNFTATSTTTETDGKKGTMLMKLDKAGNSELTISSDGTEAMHIISIGNDTYTKDMKDNQWTKTTSTTGDDKVLDSNDWDYNNKEKNVEDKTTYKKIGTEKCGNLTCFKYQIIDPENTYSTSYIFFDNKDYKMRKMLDQTNDGQITETIIDYANITISVPSPVKEGSADDTVSNALFNSIGEIPTPATE